MISLGYYIFYVEGQNVHALYFYVIPGLRPVFYTGCHKWILVGPSSLQNKFQRHRRGSTGSRGSIDPTFLSVGQCCLPHFFMHKSMVGSFFMEALSATVVDFCIAPAVIMFSHSGKPPGVVITTAPIILNIHLDAKLHKICSADSHESNKIVATSCQILR